MDASVYRQLRRHRLCRSLVLGSPYVFSLFGSEALKLDRGSKNREHPSFNVQTFNINFNVQCVNYAIAAQMLISMNRACCPTHALTWRIALCPTATVAPVLVFPSAAAIARHHARHLPRPRCFPGNPLGPRSASKNSLSGRCQFSGPSGEYPKRLDVACANWTALSSEQHRWNTLVILINTYKPDPSDYGAS